MGTPREQSSDATAGTLNDEVWQAGHRFISEILPELKWDSRHPEDQAVLVHEGLRRVLFIQERCWETHGEPNALINPSNDIVGLAVLVRGEDRQIVERRLREALDQYQKAMSPTLPRGSADQGRPEPFHYFRFGTVPPRWLSCLLDHGLPATRFGLAVLLQASMDYAIDSNRACRVRVPRDHFRWFGLHGPALNKAMTIVREQCKDLMRIETRAKRGKTIEVTLLLEGIYQLPPSLAELMQTRRPGKRSE